MSLFDDPQPESGAVISECGKYRYHLWRIWEPLLPTMIFVMQNPSTADATTDDPTIRKCLGFARKHGYGSISVRNVFAYRATDERELLTVADPVGPENEMHLLAARDVSLLSRLVLAWGNRLGGKRLKWAYDKAASCLCMQDPHCIGVTKSGEPRHPLMAGVFGTNCQMEMGKMTPDLKADVGRLKKLGRFGGDKLEVIEFSDGQEYTNTLERVVTAFLVSCEDDDETRTDAWLRGVGFKPDPNDKAFLRLPLIDEPYKAFLVLESTMPTDEHCGYAAVFTSYGYDKNGVEDDEDYVLATGNGTTKTRGQVRRLCAALGKTLEEARP